MIAATVSFLQFYLGFFGDRRFQFVDLLPEYDSAHPYQHMGLDEKFMGLDSQRALEEMDKYTHHCWCNPELIYADDVRGNEVWLHKPVQ